QYKEIEQSASKSTRPGGAASFRNSEGKIESSKAGVDREKENERIRQEESLKKTQKDNQNAGDQGEKPALGKSSFSRGTAPDPNANTSVTEASGFQSLEGLDSIKIKIQPTKYYKITVEEKQYKIQADQWEEDTLVSHILRKPEKVLRFHKDQIDEEALLERRFSKPFSDLFTVGAYVAGGAAVLLLVL